MDDSFFVDDRPTRLATTTLYTNRKTKYHNA